MERETSEDGRGESLVARDAAASALLLVYRDGRIVAPAAIARRWLLARFRIILPQCFDLAALRDLFAPEDLATLRADLATVSASRDLARDRTLRARPTGAPVAARIASQRRGAVVATLLLRDATPYAPFTAA
jgi:hypothetical protein